MGPVASRASPWPPRRSAPSCLMAVSEGLAPRLSAKRGSFKLKAKRCSRLRLGSGTCCRPSGTPDIPFDARTAWRCEASRT
jgi:hypothetical protein